MIKLRWTVPVTFESMVYANFNDDTDTICNACSEMTDKAEIVEIDESSLEVDFNSIEEINYWEMNE